MTQIDETVLKYLNRGNTVQNLDKAKEVKPILDYVHSVASGLQSTHDLFDVGVRLSALILAVTASLTDKHHEKNRCLTMAKHIPSIR